MNTVDIQLVKEHFIYDEETGVFSQIKKGASVYANGNGYLRLRFGRASVAAHRAAWALFYGTWPTKQIDHINFCKADNRIQNLRQLSNAQNSQHAIRARKTNKSGFLGVRPHYGKWQSSIVTNGVRRNLGTFDTPEEASAAYLAAKAIHHPHSIVVKGKPS